MSNTTSAPVCLGKIDIRAAGLRCKMLVGDLNGDGRMELLLAQPDGGIDDRYVPHQVQCLTAIDLLGNVLWQTGTPSEHPGGPGSDYPVQIYDIDADGKLEVLCVMDGRFHILDGATGRAKAVYELPDPSAHDCIIVANLSGGPHPQDIILKNRYKQMWAMDKEFKLLWTHRGNVGHFPWAYDLDGDGRDEVMAGYDLLGPDGQVRWSCRDLSDHADCIWVGDVNGDGEAELVIGGSVTVMYDRHGAELWRYEGSIESQHVALGKFRADMPGLQIAGLDRIVRGNENGKDGLFLLDGEGHEVWKEDRKSKGWLTIIETIRGWDEGRRDYIFAYRRGGGIRPTLYDGEMNAVVEFPADGYVVHADLLGEGTEQVIIYDDETASIFASRAIDWNRAPSGTPLPQSKRLYSSTLYPGGQI
ncbi:hypothetical protein N0M98_25840 [Paenibacillus doosanensis]|uniref:hypothetical protein n=1 Tax=Paenibacillus doosanensis TaxID=1229154 RepID=UPI00217FF0C4|nr:hypothetical protein [Paenibacillus doosanensis]MCS7463534.1 hypothetical protein [Paenibacillus doosanensis]